MRQFLERRIRIDGSLSKVWNLLTVPQLMKQWLSESDLEIISDFKENSDFIIKGDLHGVNFENRGKIIQLEKEKVFEYDYLSNISNLPDHNRNYTRVRFELSQLDDCVELKFTARNFPTLEIQKHVEFYWNGTLNEIKRLSEAPKDR